MQNMIGKIVEVEISKLKPHPKNPNNHSKEQIDRLAKIIAAQGFRNPVVVSNQSGYVVAGHGRLASAKQVGFKTVPVSYQDFKNEDHEYAHMVADNSISDWAELDLSAINNEILNLGTDLDIELLGLRDFKIDLSDKEEKEEPTDTDQQDDESDEVQCPKCKSKFVP